MSPYLNGWTREKVIKQIEEKNGFEKCVGGFHGANCMYRNKSNRACFVGAFIPDEIYYDFIEEKPISVIYNKYTPHWPLNVNHLTLLQKIHDEYEPSLCAVNLKEKVELFLDDLESIKYA